MKTDVLYNFISRAWLAENSLNNALKQNQSQKQDDLESVFEKLSISYYEPEKTDDAIKMSYVFVSIHLLENSIRSLIKDVLQSDFGDSWWQDRVPDKTKRIAEGRKGEDDKFRWQPRRGDDLMNYIDFDDLYSIIIYAPNGVTGNWEKFSNIFQSQDWLKQMFNVFVKTRNVLMHSGVLDNSDIERLALYIRDWIKQVG